MSWIVLLAWFAASLFAGYPLARSSLPKERRLLPLLAFGLVAGHSVQLVALVLLWGALPLGTSLLVTVTASSTAGATWLILGGARDRSQRWEWGVSRADAVLLAVLLAAYALVAHRVFVAAYTAWDAEALYWHSALVGWLGRSPFPPTSPLEPDDPLRYRYGLHALGAAVASVTSDLPPAVLASVISGVFPLGALALAGVSLRALGSVRPGLLAAVLGLIGGSVLPVYRTAQSLLGAADPAWSPHEFLGGLTSAGNTFDMLHNNVSVAMGFAVAVVALWLTWEAINARTMGGVTAAVAGLAGLGLVNEVYFAALAGAIMLHGLASSLRIGAGRDRSPWWPVGVAGLVVLASYALVAVRGGLVGGISFSSSGPGSVHMAFNLDHFGYVPAPPGIWVPQWIPLLSPDVLIDTNFILLGLPALALMAWRAGNSIAVVGLLASALALGAWLTVYPSRATYDGYRFGQAASTLYMTFAPFVLAGAAAWVPGSARLKFWIAAAAVMLLTVPHLLFAAWMAAAPPVANVAVVGSPDFAPSIWLRESPDSKRVFVPLPSSTADFRVVYDGPIPAGVAVRSILGLSGHSVPAGHGEQYWNPEPYLGPYRHASTNFDRTSLETLRIDWVYVLPSELTAEQANALRNAVTRGDLVLAKSFGEPGQRGERIVYRFTRAVPAA